MIIQGMVKFLIQDFSCRFFEWKKIKLSSTNASFFGNEDSFILKNNVNIEIIESNNNSFSFLSDSVLLILKEKKLMQ